MTRKADRTKKRMKKAAVVAVATTMLVSQGVEIKLIEDSLKPAKTVEYQTKNSKAKYRKMASEYGKKMTKHIVIEQSTAQAAFGPYPQFFFPGG